MLQWLQRLEKDVELATGLIYLQKNEADPGSSEAQNIKAEKTLNALLNSINEALTTNSYLTGSQMTIADLSCYFHVKQIKESASDPLCEAISRQKATMRWFNTLSEMLAKLGIE